MATDDLYVFMKDNDIDGIDKLKEEKIDSRTVRLMSEDGLKDYIKYHGDRLKIMEFCQKSNVPDTKRKENLLHIIRKKIKTKMKTRTGSHSSDDDNEPNRKSTSFRLIGNVNAKRNTRFVELGWIVKQDGSSKQIRTKQGGGTRNISVRKDANKEDLLQIAKKTFFQGGKSSFGKESSFSFDIWDYQEQSMRDDTTVGNMYDETGLSMIRFYLAAIMQSADKHNAGSDAEDLNQWEGESAAKRPNAQTVKTVSNTESCRNFLPEMHHQVARRDRNKSKNDVNSITERTEATSNVNDCHVLKLTDDSNLNRENQTKTSQADVMIGNLEPHNKETEIDLLDEAMFIAGMMDSTSDAEVFFTRSAFDDLNETQTNLFVKLRLHRGRVLQELVSEFEEKYEMFETVSCLPIFTFEMVLPTGDTEASEDSGGVTRDILSEFWTSFYEQCTDGSMIKIPCLRHDYTDEKWKAIAKVIVVGWKQEKYFPIQISLPFLQFCLFGKVNMDGLVDEFMSFVSPSDKQTLLSALDDFETVDKDELTDVMSNYDARFVLNRENIHKIVQEVAYKKLIQEPRHVAECWRHTLQELSMDESCLLGLRQNMEPTAKNVIKSLEFPESVSPAEACVSNHLKRYIREMTSESLRLFLRFTTGADLLLSKGLLLRL